MDTGTHFVMGLGIAGLSYVDPLVAADSQVALAVLIGVVAGAQAPDLDGVLRLKNNALYIRNHRGPSHSTPYILLWTLLITSILSYAWGFQFTTIMHLGLWVLLSIMYHVFSDLFNTYGTKAMWPFSQKWISWNIIHIFDPAIFALHVVAIILWALHAASPTVIFPILYTLIGLYYIWRTVLHARLEKSLPDRDPHHEQDDTYMLIPTVSLTAWHVVKQKADCSYVLGQYDNTGLRWVETAHCSTHAAAEASKNDSAVQSFLHFSSFACAEVRKIHAGYMVRWSDVRYRHRNKYPFVAIVMMDHEFNTIDSYVGWISESQIAKRWSVSIS